MTGDWPFDVGFTPTGRRKLLPVRASPSRGTAVKGWRGCDTLCIELVVDVPSGTIKIQGDTEVLEVAAKFHLRRCHGHVAVAGYEALEEYEFFRGA